MINVAVFDFGTDWAGHKLLKSFARYQKVYRQFIVRYRLLESTYCSCGGLVCFPCCDLKRVEGASAIAIDKINELVQSVD